MSSGLAVTIPSWDEISHSPGHRHTPWHYQTMLLRHCSGCVSRVGPVLVFSAHPDSLSLKDRWAIHLHREAVGSPWPLLPKDKHFLSLRGAVIEFLCILIQKQPLNVDGFKSALQKQRINPNPFNTSELIVSQLSLSASAAWRVFWQTVITPLTLSWNILIVRNVYVLGTVRMQHWWDRQWQGNE